MTNMSSPHIALPLHSSEDVIENGSEMVSLKALANQILQRNNAGTATEVITPSPPLVSQGIYETPPIPNVTPSSILIPPSLKDDFEERIAIAEYDGQQTSLQAHRIAYEGAIIALLNANPPDERVTTGTDWVCDRIKLAEVCLGEQGITRPS